MYRVHTLFHTLSVSIVRFVVVKHNGLVSFLKRNLDVWFCEGFVHSV